jgi:SAM-dependent methyltransferase
MMTLPPEAFVRADNSDDERFYAFPRFVTHLDDEAIAQVTSLYRTYLPADGVILDLMSSWVSHLPKDVNYTRVVGHGLNAEELAANPVFNETFVQNLNRHAQLPYSANTFDGAACCVSVQYMTQPVAVFREVARVLKADAPFVVSFSNRCFPSKAVQAWLNLDDLGHIRLVEHYFEKSESFRRTIVYKWRPPVGDPLFAVIGFAR